MPSFWNSISKRFYWLVKFFAPKSLPGAFKNKDFEAIRWHLDRGADPNFKGADGKSALNIIVDKYFDDISQIRRGEGIAEGKSEEQRRDLYKKCIKDNVELIMYLSGKRGNFNNFVLNKEILQKEDSLPLVTALSQNTFGLKITKGQDITHNDLVKRVLDYNPYDPACYKSHTSDYLKASIGRYDPASQGWLDQDLLTSAIAQSKWSLVDVVFERKCVGSKYFTEPLFYSEMLPLNYAISKGLSDTKLVDKFIEANAKVTQKDKYGNALHAAIRMDSPSVDLVRHLINKGVNPHDQNQFGESILGMIEYKIKQSQEGDKVQGVDVSSNLDNESKYKEIKEIINKVTQSRTQHAESEKKRRSQNSEVPGKGRT